MKRKLGQKLGRGTKGSLLRFPALKFLGLGLLVPLNVLSCLLYFSPSSIAQGPPLPGGGSASSAPMPGFGAPVSGAVSVSAPIQGAAAPVPGGGSAAPIPGPSPAQVLGSGAGSPAYRRLPLNHQTAAVRLEELRNIMISAKPKEFQDAITDYLDWLGDMADGHWKIYQSFSKVDSMKPQADVEKNTTLRLGSLKRQAMLLKAEFLIRNNRQPEALQPLIDIVVAEPKTATGDAAYSLLKQIGFSEEVPISPVAGAH